MSDDVLSGMDFDAVGSAMESHSAQLRPLGDIPDIPATPDVPEPGPQEPDAVEDTEEVVEETIEELPEVEESLEDPQEVEEEPNEEAEEESNEEADEPAEEKPKSGKLKAILRKEQKLLETKREFKQLQDKLKAEREEFEKMKSEFDFEKVKQMEELFTAVKEGGRDGKRKLLDTLGVTDEDILKASFETNPEWVKKNLKDFVDELGADIDPKSREQREKEAALANKEEEIRKKEEAQAERDAKAQSHKVINKWLSPVIEQYPVVRAWDSETVIDDIVANISAMQAHGVVTDKTKIPEVLDMILPELEQHYTQMISGPMSAVQSKRAKEASKRTKTEAVNEGRKPKSQKIKPAKTLKGNRTAAPKKQEVDVENVPVRERHNLIDHDVINDFLKSI